MSKTINPLVSIAVSVLSLIVTSPTVAASVEEQRSVNVSYRDLDLRNEQGVTRLQQRVRLALNAVCGEAGSRDLNARAQVNRCRELAMTKAQDNVQIAVIAARSDTQLAQNMHAPSIKVDAH